MTKVKPKTKSETDIKFSTTLKLSSVFPAEFINYIEKYDSRRLKQELYYIVEFALVNHSNTIMTFLDNGWYPLYLKFTQPKEPSDVTRHSINIHVVQDKFPEFYRLWSTLERSQKSLKITLLLYLIFINLGKENDLTRYAEQLDDLNMDTSKFYGANETGEINSGYGFDYDRYSDDIEF